MFKSTDSAKLEIETTQSIEEAREKVIKKIRTSGGEIKVSRSNDIVAGFGSSLKTRLFGAFFVSESTIPRDLFVNFKKRDDKIIIKIEAKDTFGFGTRAGFESKYQKILYNQVYDIKELFD